MTGTEAKWSERVADWRASGKTAEEYAQGRGFEPSTLRFWSSRLRQIEGRTAKGATPRVRMARVVSVGSRVPAAERPLVVVVGGARIEVRGGFDRRVLREIVDALGGER